MEKMIWKAGNMLYPVPAVMVSCGDLAGNQNIITVAWAGTVCSDPPMLSISVRPERHSYHILKESKEFVVNLTTEALVRQADLAGVKSGKDVDKWKLLQLTPQKAKEVKAPLIAESPVNMECRVKEAIPLGSHTLFLAEILAVHVHAALMETNGRLALEKAGLVAYSHGEYYGLGKLLGRYGYSVKKTGKNCTA